MTATNETNNWFYRPDESKADYAKKLAERDKTVYVDLDGVAKCRYCHAPRMYHLKGDYGGKCDKWLPIACKCKGEYKPKKPPNKQLQEYDEECPF